MGTQYEKQGYLSGDFRLFHLRSAGGVKTEYHYHEFYKVLLLLSGSGGYWVDGCHYALQPGDAVLVGSSCVHRPEFDESSPYERIIIYISPEFLSRASTADCDLTGCFSGVLRPEKAAGRRLQAQALDLEKELAGKGYGSAILGTGLLLQLLAQLARQLRQGGILDPGPVQPKDQRVADMLRYIDDHLSEELSIDDLAERFYLSKFHMMRLFRSGTGASINAYITQRRLMQAREWIAQGVPATESCFRAGFGSYSAFTRAYGKFYGTTPTGRKSAVPFQQEGFE